MKTKARLVAFMVLASLLFASVFASCATTSVSRVSSDTVTDLTGFWNDTDVRQVCDDLIAKCLASPRVKAFQEKNGRLPVIMVGKFKNDSTEHIDTSIITGKMEDAIINSGMADFVADKSDRAELREEVESQNRDGYTSEETAKAMGDETGADFILKGSVKTMVESAGNKTVRTYFVTAQLLDLQKGLVMWNGRNDEIKKIVTTKKPKL